MMTSVSNTIAASVIAEMIFDIIQPGADVYAQNAEGMQ